MEKFLLIFFITIALLFSACSSSKENSQQNSDNKESQSEANNQLDTELYKMELFRFNYTNPMAGAFRVSIKEDDNELIFDFITYFDFSEDVNGAAVEVKKEVDDEVLLQIEELCQKYDIYSWDGYEGESIDGLTDAESFSLYIEFSNGQKISASSSSSIPENYTEFYEELHNLTLAIAKE